MHCIDAAYCYKWSSVFRLCVCVRVSHDPTVSPTKTDESIKISFWEQIRLDRVIVEQTLVR